MAIRYIVKAKVGEYVKDGETKAKYANIGVVMDGKNGFVLKLETIPCGNWDGFCFLSDPEERGRGGNGGGNRGGGGGRSGGGGGGAGRSSDMDDDIPF